MMPGGLWRHGECRRDWSFRTLTGEVELSILEAGRDRRSIPQRVTAVLTAALAELGGAAAQPDVVRALSVADRQYLMRRLAVEIGIEESWIAARCPRCGAGFDIPIRHSELPVKPAGEGYPFATVETSLGPVRFRVPDGADQEAVAGIEDPRKAWRALAARCVAQSLSGELSDEDLDRAEAALEAVAPEVVTRAQAACPDCGKPAEVHLDPYVCLGAADSGLFLDVHALASAYHWSEREILAMPRERRRLYLSLVDQSRGVVS
jgi:ribosomal protein S27AE